jgi:DNA invertase Pin-like site-specific DNA recombinase
MEHGESTQRQYALADRAVALGWSRDAVEVIDEDQGTSGASTKGREGFARLAHAVAHGEVGAVLAVEVSRLARCSEDWRRLLSLCAVAECAVIDEQTIYDAGNSDDRLLLDLKGTMSEAELQWLGLRLTGARRNKARRGELRIRPPTGYVWAERGLELDPDEAVQHAVRVVLERYAIEPSAWAVVRWAREAGVQFPTRQWHAGGGSDVTWKPLGISRLHEMLRNPLYAGAYVYGRRPHKTVLIDGEIRSVRVPGRNPEHWAACIKDAHTGYISWEAYVSHQKKLSDNHARRGAAAKGAPREGAALLSGLVLCGRCGRRMRPSYDTRSTRRFSYICGGDRDKGQVMCWSVPGEPIDRAVETLLLETVKPSELDLCLAVEREVGGQTNALERQWRSRLEQAGYAARHAERRYKAVDPDNRVVARTLEREWEQRLRELEEVQQHFEQARQHRRIELSSEDRTRIRSLARDLLSVWKATTTTPADRKAMLRLVFEAISLSPVDVPRRATRVRVQWQSRAVTELEVPRPDRRERKRTPALVIERIRREVEGGASDDEIAARLNAEGVTTGASKAWNAWAVRWARGRAKISRMAHDCPRDVPLPDRHPDNGQYSVGGVAKRFGVTATIVYRWIHEGLLRGHRESFGSHPHAWWLHVDEATAARLDALPRRPRRA